MEEDPYNPISEESPIAKLPDEIYLAIAKFMTPTTYFNVKATCQIMKWKSERVERGVILPIYEVTFKKDEMPKILCVEPVEEDEEKITHELPGTRFGLEIRAFFDDSSKLTDDEIDGIETFFHGRKVSIDMFASKSITCSFERFKKFVEKYSISKLRVHGTVPVTFLEFIADRVYGIVAHEDNPQLIPGGMDYVLKTPITCGELVFPKDKPFTAVDCRRLIEAVDSGSRQLGHIMFYGADIPDFNDIFAKMLVFDYDKNKDYDKELIAIRTRPVVFKSAVYLAAVVVTKDNRFYKISNVDDEVFVHACDSVGEYLERVDDEEHGDDREE